nr:DNA-directed DNA polymerase [Tanacetum cinerariifolium]
MIFVVMEMITLTDMACEEYLQEVLGFFDVIASGNPTPYYDPIVSTTYPTLTSFEDSDFLLEEVDAFLALEDDRNYLLEVRKELKICEAKSDKSSIDEPPEVELKDLLPHLEYAFLEGDDKLLVIIAKNLSVEEKTALITVSLVHCVSKKGGFTVVENEGNELIPNRLVTGWRVCIDYHKLNEATRKDHFPLPFMDQMLERLEGNKYYYFLDGFSGYFQIPIDPKDQEKTTFTCPYETFAYRRMPFGLCNAPVEFRRCMMAIFHDMIEKTMEVFMDDFLVFGNSFQTSLSHLEKMLKWPMTRLLEKDTPFLFSKECIEAFLTLKRKLTEAPILIAPDWDMPFELMYDASDFAIGVVLGQRQEKHFRLIHYASKTMTEAESNYTTTEKEMLAVVYAFEKFRSYLIMNKSIVYTDHSTLKYLYDFANYHGGISLSRACRPNRTINSSRMKPLTFLRLATMDPPRDITALTTQPRRDEMPQNSIQVCEIFDVWGINFMGPFLSFKGNKYILVAVNYLSKWVKAKALPTNDARVVCKFLKTLFARFGTPRAIISDRGTHFCNDHFAKIMMKFDVTHRFATPYHPQTSGQVEVSNCGLKRILERTVGENRASKSDKLDDAL